LGFVVRVLGFVEKGSRSDESTVGEGFAWAGLREGTDEVGDTSFLGA
jgi:hypothetical protein